MAKAKQTTPQEPKVFVEIVGIAEDGFATAANGKKFATTCKLKVGDQIVGIMNGAKLSEIDPRFDGIKTVKTDVDGICYNVDRFMEIHAAIAFSRIEWLGMDATTRPPFEAYVVGKDFSPVINVK